MTQIRAKRATKSMWRHAAQGPAAEDQRFVLLVLLLVFDRESAAVTSHESQPCYAFVYHGFEPAVAAFIVNLNCAGRVARVADRDHGASAADWVMAANAFCV